MRFARLYFSKYQLFPFWGLPICTSSNINSFLFGVCPSVLLQISTPSFLGFARLYYSKYQLLPFWGLPVCTSPNINFFLLWLRLRASLLHPYAIIPFFVCHSIGSGCIRPKRLGFTQPSHLLGPLCCAGEVPQQLGQSARAPHTRARVNLAVCFLSGRDVPDHTPTITF